jgi:Cft2 family RNA processing exonuclease
MGWKLTFYGGVNEIGGNKIERARAYTEPEVDAVFLSHAHFDHITPISFWTRKSPFTFV